MRWHYWSLVSMDYRSVRERGSLVDDLYNYMQCSKFLFDIILVLC